MTYMIYMIKLYVCIACVFLSFGLWAKGGRFLKGVERVRDEEGCVGVGDQTNGIGN